jgi:hypothetical protein
MKRIAALVAGVLLVALLPTSLAGAGAAPVSVSFLAGLGDNPGDNPVDVYLGETDATEWDLVLADQGFADFSEIGDLAAGGYNVLLCDAVPAPLATIEGCSDNEAPAVNGNFGTNVTLPAVASVTLVGAYAGAGGAIGRPTVVGFENDLSCVEPGTGRMSINAAGAATGNWAVDGVDEGTVDFGEALVADLPADAYDVAYFGADFSASIDGLELDAATLLSVYFVGNPQQDAPFQLVPISLDVPLCDQPTTTTTVGPTTTTVRPAPAAVATVAQPRFTG